MVKKTYKQLRGLHLIAKQVALLSRVPLYVPSTWWAMLGLVEPFVINFPADCSRPSAHLLLLLTSRLALIASNTNRQLPSQRGSESTKCSPSSAYNLL